MNSKVPNIKKRKERDTKVIPFLDTFFGDTVEVSLHRPLKYPNKQYIWVSVWTDDDLGFEKQFYNIKTAQECFNEVSKWTDCSINKLKKNGFTNG